MTAPPHNSQLVPNTPIWFQLVPTSTKKSGIQLPRSGCIQNPRDLQLLRLPSFPNYDVVLAMVCANPRAITIKHAHCFYIIHGNCQCCLMVCASHIPAGQGKKSWTCSYCVPSMRNRKCSNPHWVCDILVECTVCNKT